MIKLGRTGAAALTITVLSALAVVGGSAGSAVAVDTYVEPRPDSPFYGLGRAGESIKELAFRRDQSWHLNRADRRTREFIEMAEENKAQEYEELLDEADFRFRRAVETSNKVRNLERVENALRKRIEVLENVRNEVSEEAKPAISLAISRSSQARTSVSAAISTSTPQNTVPERARNKVVEELQNVEEKLEKIRENVRGELQKGGDNIEEIRKIVGDIEIETANNLTEKIGELADENIPGNVIVEVTKQAQNRISAAAEHAVENRSLERAIEASRRHLEILEEIENRVPEEAEPYINLARERSSHHIGILENVRKGLENNEITSGEIMNTVRGEVDRIGERIRERRENLRDRIQGAIDEDNFDNLLDNLKEEAGNRIENVPD